MDMTVEAQMPQLLALLPMFQHIGSKEIDELAEKMTLRSYPKHSLVMSEGDDSGAMFVIISGKIKTFLTDDTGREVVLGFHGPGECFGEMALLDENPRSASIMTTEACRFGLLTKADFMALLSQQPDMALSVIRYLTHRLRELTGRVRELALLDVYGRLTKTLLNMSEPQGDRRVVKELLTHQDLANLVGSSREMVTKILKDLMVGGYIDVENKRITLNEKLPPRW
jgi:CRP/FNR family cyclic AMP-dependent transcriptional regulator